MDITLRRGKPEDAADCGEICYAAFRDIAERHRFAPDFPDTGAAVSLLTTLFDNPGFYSVVAECDGRIIGSNFLDERGVIAGVGPITIDPAHQDRAAGRRLMQHVLERAASHNAPGVRLVQAAYHNRSLSLYTRLGFTVREPLAVLQGTPPDIAIPGYRVRGLRRTDEAACNALCLRVHGHDRAGELHDALRRGTAQVAEMDGHIAAYTTGIGFLGHAVAENDDALKALIASAQEFTGPGFLLPTRQGELFRWCLAQGLRVVQPMTLMSTGLYNQPDGAWLPAVLY